MSVFYKSLARRIAYARIHSSYYIYNRDRLLLQNQTANPSYPSHLPQSHTIEALKAAQRKATYLVKALDKRLGDEIRIVEKDSDNAFPFAQSNVLSSDAASFDNFRTIKKNYSILARFEIADK